jgi:hypothetical protein
MPIINMPISDEDFHKLKKRINWLETRDVVHGSNLNVMRDIIKEYVRDLRGRIVRLEERVKALENRPGH